MTSLFPWQLYPREGVLLIMANTRRLWLKEVPFSGIQVYKSVGISQLEVFEKIRKSEYLDFHHNMNWTNNTSFWLTSLL